MAGSWSRERPANGQENAGIDDRGVRGSGCVVAASTRVRRDLALGRSAVSEMSVRVQAGNVAWLRMNDRRLSDCAATLST